MSQPSETVVEVTPADWASLLPPLFARCVGEEHGRYDLSRPHAIDDHLYATDGRIAARMRTPPGWAVPNTDGKFPAKSIVALFGGDHESHPAPVPEVAGVCPWCDGGGRAAPTKCQCPDCGCEVDLPERPCDRCGGSKVLDHLVPVAVVPGYWIARGYAALLREHGVGSLSIPADLDYHKPARFTSGEVEGLLMPMSPPDAAEGP